MGSMKKRSIGFSASKRGKKIPENRNQQQNMDKVIREIEQIKYPQQMTGNRDTIVCCVCCILFMIKSKSE